jgi:two-component system, chemotaxis family, protein-glutamate methylesterase/glutaminase
MSRRVRALIVEDSLTVRRYLAQVLAGDPEIEVVGEAADGREAIALCERLRPDVVSLDMIMPLLDGVAVTEHIMAHFPTPILVVSASMNRGELFSTYDALAAGAVDVLDKPSADASSEEWEARFRSTVKLISRIRVITHLRARLRSPANRSGVPPHAAARFDASVIALGASTGGPAALVRVLADLPAPSPVPILVVLHIGEPFGAAFAEWLDGQVPHSVRCAEGGEALSSLVGRVTIAPPGKHLLVAGGRLELSHGPERHSCRPSVDVLFESVAAEIGSRAVACLLTGMGRDGAAGLLAVRDAGGFTIAQDQASSVIFGMPREAVRLGAAQRVLALDEIGMALGDAIARAERT